MNTFETVEFLEFINNHTEQEIIYNLNYISEYFHKVKFWPKNKCIIQQLLAIVDKNKLLYGLFNNQEKFSKCNETLDLSDELKFGLEIEFATLPLEAIKYAFETHAILEIMKILQIPNDVSEAIINNSNFEKKVSNDKWIFSKETEQETETSSPILQNTIFDLNQVVAICTLLKSFGASLNGRTGLHVNIGVNYLECNEKAINNILKIWGECEELFFKMASPEGERIRLEAFSMAEPVKENIQNFFKEDGSVTLNNEEDIEKFLYQIQAKNRLQDIISYSNVQTNENFEDVLFINSKTEEEKFKFFHKYIKFVNKNDKKENKVRWTSINFNHIEWNVDSPGRIEVRIFNSSLEPEIIFQDVLLIGKLFEVSLKNAKDSSYKNNEFQKLFLHDITEERKVKNLLNLLFDDNKPKETFYKRWKSIKDDIEYKKYRSGEDTFER